MSVGTMAKKKRPGERSPKNKERKDLSGFRTIGFRVSVEYAEWLEAAARHNRITIAAFLDRAAANEARVSGFDQPPPERIP
jgi:hypothetical protein